MLDKDLFAHAIGIVKNNNTITIKEMCESLAIDEHKAVEILDGLVDCGFVESFDGFYGRCDLIGFN